MAIGKASDFVVYQEEFYGGMYERVAQITAGFNGGSANTIRLVQKELKGDYNKDSFLKIVSSLVTRRDTTSVSGATDLAMTMGENIGVKINRKIGPAAQTLDAWRKIGADAREMSFKLGQMIGEAKGADYINTAILAARAGIVNNGAGTYVDKTGATPDTVTHSHLTDMLALMGDQSAGIKMWVMHSTSYFQLIKQAISDKVYEVAGATIYSGSVATLGRPTLVIDAPGLLVAGSPNVYYVLGLVENGVVVTESEQEEIVSEIVTGLENLVFRIQGEYAFNLNLKGYKWDVTNGGANPADATVGTGTNWDKVATSDKQTAGVAGAFN